MENYVDNGKGILVPDQVLGNGRYYGELIREGRVIDEFEIDNIVVNQGLNYMLGVSLHGDTQYSSWYMGLFEGNYTPVAADTAASIASNSTETTAITSSTRPAWTPSAASAQSISNSSNRAVFTFNATKNLYGAFIISDSVIGGTSGVLFSAARFANVRPVQNGDQLLMTYTFNAASS